MRQRVTTQGKNSEKAVPGSKEQKSADV